MSPGSNLQPSRSVGPACQLGNQTMLGNSFSGSVACNESGGILAGRSTPAHFHTASERDPLLPYFNNSSHLSPRITHGSLPDLRNNAVAHHSQLNMLNSKISTSSSHGSLGHLEMLMGGGLEPNGYMAQSPNLGRHNSTRPAVNASTSSLASTSERVAQISLLGNRHDSQSDLMQWPHQASSGMSSSSQYSLMNGAVSMPPASSQPLPPNGMKDYELSTASSDACSVFGDGSLGLDTSLHQNLLSSPYVPTL